MWQQVGKSSKTGRSMLARSIDRRSIACRSTVIRGAPALAGPPRGARTAVIDLPLLGVQAQGHQLVHDGWILVDSQPTLVVSVPVLVPGSASTG